MSMLMRLVNQRLVRFGIVAGTCTVLQLLLMLGLVALGVDSLVANGIGFVLSAQVNFALSAIFTYRDRQITWSRAIILTRWLPFNATALWALAVNELVFTFGVDRIGHISASLCGTLVGACVSFTIGNKAIFTSEQSERKDIPVDHTMGTATQQDVDPMVAARLREGGIAFFMPAWNEADNLPRVVGSVHDFFKAIGCPFTIIVVNDGSTDDTRDVTDRLKQRYGQHFEVVHQPNMGYGGALRTGFKHSLGLRHDLIAFFDGDGQFDIADVNLLIKQLIDDDAQLSIGIRSRRADPLRRRLMGRGWHMLSKYLLGYEATDVDCGFKVFTRHTIEKVSPKLRGNHATISPELLIRARKAGFNTTEVSVKHLPRIAGEQSGANLKVVLSSLAQVFEIRRLIRQEG